jgi:hypothetical protein
MICWSLWHPRAKILPSDNPVPREPAAQARAQPAPDFGDDTVYYCCHAQTKRKRGARPPAPTERAELTERAESTDRAATAPLSYNFLLARLATHSSIVSRIQP